MKEKSKLIIAFILSVTLIIGLLTSCSAIEKKLIVKKVENKEPREELKAIEKEGIFIKSFQEKFVDITTNGKKIMFLYNEELKEAIKEIKQKDSVTFKYTINNKHEFVLKEIRVNEQKTNEKEAKTILSERTYKSDLGFETILMDNFKEKNGLIVNKDNNDYYIKIEERPISSKIKPLRWESADELNKISKFKELQGDNIKNKNLRDNKFYFTATNGKVTKTILVKDFNGHLLKVTYKFPNNLEEVELTMEAMISNIEFVR